MHQQAQHQDNTESAYTLDEALENITVSTVGEIRGADMERQSENARRNPRALRTFQDRLRELCTLTEEIASSCTYSLPRGGRRVVGPSVRFAELVVASYRNLHVSTTIIDVSDTAVVIRGSVLDLETNTLTEGDCRRLVQKKRGQSKADEDMKQLAVASGTAIAYRNTVFKAVPRALWDPVWRESQKAASGSGTMAQRRAAAIEAYAELGASEADVLGAFGRNGPEELTIDDLRHLRGMIISIRSGDLTVGEALRPLEADKPRGRAVATRSSLAEKLDSKAEQVEATADA